MKDYCSICQCERPLLGPTMIDEDVQIVCSFCGALLWLEPAPDDPAWQKYDRERTAYYTRLGRVCPECGNVYSGVPATSRKDNKTKICSACGVQEARAAFVQWQLSEGESSR